MDGHHQEHSTGSQGSPHRRERVQRCPGPQETIAKPPKTIENHHPLSRTAKGIERDSVMAPFSSTRCTSARDAVVLILSLARNPVGLSIFLMVYGAFGDHAGVYLTEVIAQTILDRTVMNTASGAQTWESAQSKMEQNEGLESVVSWMAHKSQSKKAWFLTAKAVLVFRDFGNGLSFPRQGKPAMLSLIRHEAQEFMTVATGDSHCLCHTNGSNLLRKWKLERRCMKARLMRTKGDLMKEMVDQVRLSSCHAL